VARHHYAVDLSPSSIIWCCLKGVKLLHLQQATFELWCLSGGKRGDYQNHFVLYCVLKLCTVISTLRWAVAYSFLNWVLSHWAHFIVHRCICLYVSTVGWTWWDWSLIIRTYLFSVLWYRWLGHLTCKNSSLIWSIMCLDGKPCSLYSRRLGRKQWQPSTRYVSN